MSTGTHSLTHSLTPGPLYLSITMKDCLNSNYLLYLRIKQRIYLSDCHGFSIL